MVKKSLFWFVLFLLGYSLFIAVYPNKGVGTHQWQENQIKVHKYLYGGQIDSVIVGTSLSARILADSIPSICSCAFSGCVVEDGLRIILSQQKTPKYVFIETNYSLRSSNGDIVKTNIHGVLPFLRKFIPALREQNAPICVFGSWCMPDALAPSAVVELNRLNENIGKRLNEDLSKRLSDAQLAERLAIIKQLVNLLEKRGATIVFFEMPLNKRLIHAESNNQTRQAIRRSFPDSHYVFIPTDTSTYITSDGEHLDREGQRRYSHFFKEHLKNL